MPTAHSITTARQLLQTHGLGRCELIKGERITTAPAGFEHGRIVMRISVPLATHVENSGLGIVVGAETGFQIEHNPDTVRAPDVAFLCAQRVPQEPVRGFFDGAPDLAVEVLSPDDRPREIAAKAADWLHAVCREVWIVDPCRRGVQIHRKDQEPIELDETQEIASDELLPGFRLSVAQVFSR